MVKLKSSHCMASVLESCNTTCCSLVMCLATRVPSASHAQTGIPAVSTIAALCAWDAADRQTMHTYRRNTYDLSFGLDD